MRSRSISFNVVMRAIWPALGLCLGLLAIYLLAQTRSLVFQREVTQMLVNVVLVVGLYTFAGNSGILSFGHMSFMAIGAYATALVTIPEIQKAFLLPDLPNWLAGVELPTLVAAIVVGLLFWLVYKRTRVGMVVRAGVDDTQMTSALGVNVQWVFAIAFFVGSALAGLGGAFAGTSLSLAPGQDQSFLVSALVVVIVGGMGSLGGAALGALLLGLVDQYASAYLPPEYSNLSALLTFVLLAAILAVRPTGLFGKAQ